MPDDEAGEDFVRHLVGFARYLRSEGVTVGPGDSRAYVATTVTLDPTDLLDLYWAGRISLVSRHEDLATYDETFQAWFLERPGHKPPMPFTPQQVNELMATIAVPEAEHGTEKEQSQQAVLGVVGSDVAVHRGKAFTDCTADELAALRRVIATMRLMPPRRRTRRHRAVTRRGTPDIRRTVRQAMRHQGEIDSIARRDRKLRPRRLVLLLDVSGSMADHSRNLLQFAHATRRASDRTEVFCFGTTLTRITRALRHRSPDAALALAADTVNDWAGGTRIGSALDTFVRDFGRRGMSRGAVVVICSDGLDRGDPGLLDNAMARLQRLSHAVVWVSPDHVPGGVQPLGLQVASPYVDRIVSGRDLVGLSELAATVPQLG